ncbi:hypothetical protein LguiB_031400 [Lonicera macranthoides]
MNQESQMGYIDARIGTSIDSFYEYLLKPAFHSTDQAPAGLTAPHGHIHIKRSEFLLCYSLSHSSVTRSRLDHWTVDNSQQLVGATDYRARKWKWSGRVGLWMDR